MNPEEVKQLILYSEKSTDKIVGVWQGSFNMSTAPKLSGASLPYTTINHGFTRPLFTKSQFSVDGQIWTDANTGSPYDSNSLIGITYSTDTQLFVVAATIGAPSGTAYYRVIGFWIDDYDDSNPSVPPTIGTQSSIYFDSRLNYQKIFTQGTATLNGENGTLTVNHNLGYEPNVRVYNEMLPGQIWPANYGGTKNRFLYDFDMTECVVQVTTTTLDLTFQGSVSSPPARLWYIIYYDA